MHRSFAQKLQSTVWPEISWISFYFSIVHKSFLSMTNAFLNFHKITIFFTLHCCNDFLLIWITHLIALKNLFSHIHRTLYSLRYVTQILVFFWILSIDTFKCKKACFIFLKYKVARHQQSNWNLLCTYSL